jgi:hypothetical protein
MSTASMSVLLPPAIECKNDSFLSIFATLNLVVLVAYRVVPGRLSLSFFLSLYHDSHHLICLGSVPVCPLYIILSVFLSRDIKVN